MNSEKYQTLENNQQGIKKEKYDLLLNDSINKLNNIDLKFKEWFIGFIEGDGSFYITNGKPIFSIHLNIIDLPLLYLIQSELNMGSISFNKNKRTTIFTVKAKVDILTLILLFNGNLFLTKRKVQFNKWVEIFNKKYNFNVNIKINQFVPSFNNGWISGFTDAEGSFLVSIIKKENTNKIIQRFILSQKDSKEELNYLKTLVKGYVEISKGCDRLVINYLELENIINYFKNFPLCKIEILHFVNWNLLEKIIIIQLRKN